MRGMQACTTKEPTVEVSLAYNALNKTRTFVPPGSNTKASSFLLIAFLCFLLVSVVVLMVEVHDLKANYKEESARRHVGQQSSPTFDRLKEGLTTTDRRKRDDSNHPLAHFISSTYDDADIVISYADYRLQDGLRWKNPDLSSDSLGYTNMEFCNEHDAECDYNYMITIHTEGFYFVYSQLTYVVTSSHNSLYNGGLFKLKNGDRLYVKLINSGDEQMCQSVSINKMPEQTFFGTTLIY